MAARLSEGPPNHGASPPAFGREDAQVLGSGDVTQPLDAEGLRVRVQKALDDFLAAKVDVLDAVSDDLGPLMDSISDLLRGGKRLRAAFCYWGWRGAGGP